MANRFWVGGTGDWDGSSTSHWSATSGGSSGASAPTSADDVFIDANSSPAGEAVSATTGSVCKSFTATGFLGVLRSSGNLLPKISGNVVFGSVNSFITSTFRPEIIATASLTMNGVELVGNNTITVNGAGITVTLLDTFTSLGELALTAGTFDANNHNVTLSSFSSSNTNTRTLTMGSGLWTIEAVVGSFSWNVGVSTNLTLNAGTSTIKYTDTANSARTFAGGGKTYNNLWLARGASIGNNTITGANTFNDFKDDGSAAHQIIWPATWTNTFTTFTVSGNPGALISLRSSSVGNQADLSKASGTVTRDYLDIKDINVTGGAVWNPGANSVDSGNNSGWFGWQSPGQGRMFLAF